MALLWYSALSHLCSSFKQSCGKTNIQAALLYARYGNLITMLKFQVGWLFALGPWIPPGVFLCYQSYPNFTVKDDAYE